MATSLRIKITTYLERLIALNIYGKCNSSFNISQKCPLFKWVPAYKRVSYSLQWSPVAFVCWV